jgi:adenylyl-sulfate kinase
MPAIVKVFWLFGRSGAGKTTLARRLHQALQDKNIPVFYVDGDEMRSGLNSDLGFTPAARQENHRRCAELAQLAAAQGFNVVVSTIAPEYAQRDAVQNILGAKLVWFYIHAPLEVCIRRDPKGLYQKAKTGKINQLLDYPFDTPRPPERENWVDTVANNVDECQQSIISIVHGHLTGAMVCGL